MNKPFDLQKALAGEPVFTEGDTGHYQFTLAGNSKSDEHRHVFKMKAHDEQEPHEYIIISDDFGNVISGYTGQDFDNLTMAPVKKTVWVNIYSKPSQIGEGAVIQATQHPHDDQGTAKACRDNLVSNGYSVHATVPIEIEL